MVEISTVIISQSPIDKCHLKIPDLTIADAICDHLLKGVIAFNLKMLITKTDNQTPRQYYIAVQTTDRKNPCGQITAD